MAKRPSPRLQVVVSHDLAKRIIEQAQAERRTVSQFLRVAAESYLERSAA